MKAKLFQRISGQTKSHLTELNETKLIHKDALKSFVSLRAEAQKEDIDLAVLSSFRSFEDQLKIWNKKASGQSPLLDDSGAPLEFDTLDEEQVLFAILRWSALPGASRHHWGTDLDVYDKNQLIKKDYNIELIPSEYEDGGIFSKLSSWLDQKIIDDKAFGFYRPYQNDLGGVAPELWHISFKKVSDDYLNSFTQKAFKELLENSIYQEMLLKDVVLDNAAKIYNDYIINISR